MAGKVNDFSRISVPPTRNVRSSWFIPMLKESGSGLVLTSSSDRPRYSAQLSTAKRALRCVTMTPLGLPVLPEV